MQDLDRTVLFTGGGCYKNIYCPCLTEPFNGIPHSLSGNVIEICLKHDDPVLDHISIHSFCHAENRRPALKQTGTVPIPRPQGCHGREVVDNPVSNVCQNCSTSRSRRLHVRRVRDQGILCMQRISSVTGAGQAISPPAIGVKKIRSQPAVSQKYSRPESHGDRGLLVNQTHQKVYRPTT